MTILVAVVVLLVLLLAALVWFAASTARKVEAALPPRGQFKEIGGDRIHYVDTGGAAPAVVMIHGLGGNARNFEALAGALVAGLMVALVAGTMAYASVHRYEPNMRGTPVAAVAELKKLNLSRVFNDYDFGGYLIASGVPTFIDGRTELFGETFFVDHNNASGLMEPENLFRLLDDYKIEATLMRTQSAATKLLDHVDGWQRVYSDDVATIHLRKAGAVHTVEPAVEPKPR